MMWGLPHAALRPFYRQRHGVPYQAQLRPEWQSQPDRSLQRRARRLPAPFWYSYLLQYLRIDLLQMRKEVWLSSLWSLGPTG